MASKPQTAVIIMTYGSATTAKQVPAYLAHIYHKPAPQEVIKDFQKRYSLIGYSPLIDITQEQAALLQKKLGKKYIVRAAMLHSAPFIENVVLECKKAGAKKLVGIILSPQFSAFIMEGYGRVLTEAAIKYGFSKESIAIAEPWPIESHFIALLTHRVTASLQKLERLHGVKIPVVFTTHSLPQRVVSKDPAYLKQLTATSNAVVRAVKNPFTHYAAYQSAGHTPEQWLKPDLVDIVKKMAQKKVPAVLIVPIQFLADHLEILYDLDRAASEQCAQHGIAYNRIQLPNIDPLFIASLISVTKKTEKVFK